MNKLSVKQDKKTMSYEMSVEINKPSEKRTVVIKGGVCQKCKLAVPIAEAFDHACKVKPGRKK